MSLALTNLNCPLANITQFAASPTLLMACDGNTGAYALSANGGGTWSTHALPVASARELLHDGAQFIAVSGKIAYRSADGLAWTAGAAAGVTATFCTGLAAGGGKLVAAWPSNQISVSSDAGATWAVSAPFTWTQGLAVGYDAGLGKFLVVVSGTNAGVQKTMLLASTDGAAWTTLCANVDPGNQANVDHIHVIGSTYLITGNWPPMYSTDAGATFTRGTLDRSFGTGVLSGTFIYASNNFSSGDNFLWQSADGHTWDNIHPDGDPDPQIFLQGFTASSYTDASALYFMDNTSTTLYMLAVASLPPAAFWTTLIGTTEPDLATHTLLKDTGTATTKGSAGTPGTPGHAGYTSWESVTVCGLYLDNATYEWVTPTDGSDPQYMLVSGGFGSASYRCVTTKKPVWHPPVPATPGTPSTPDATTQNFHLGWNAGARSIPVLRGDGTVTFTVPSVVGAAAGFNRTDKGTQYGEIEHGLLIASGIVRVIESGAIEATVGLFAPGDTFTIKRLAGQVTYWKGATLLYTSAAPSSGAVFLDASLYSGGDQIASPAFGPAGGANLQLPRLAARGGLATAGAALKLPALRVVAPRAQGGALKLAALQAFGGRRTASARLALPSIEADAEGAYTLPRFAVGAIELPRLQVGGHGLSGTIGGAHVQLPRLRALGSDRIYGEARITLPRLAVAGSAYEGPLNATLAQFTRAHASMAGSAQLAVLMHSSGQLGAVMAYSCVMGARMDDGAHADDSMGAQAVLQALMRDGAVARVTGAGEEPRTSDWEVWSMDWDSGDSTAYEGFEFNSFAKVGGRHFGAMRGGIYLLEGDDDAGAPIRASAHFGAHDFGESVHKRVPNVYAGVSASGQLLLRVSVDGGSDYLYAARGVDVARKVTRFDLGRGLRGTYYVFELFNQDGADFDLDAIEFLPVALTRRI